MTSSKILLVSVPYIALACLANVSLASPDREGDESQAREEIKLSENEPPVVGDMVANEQGYLASEINQYEFEATMENHEDKPVRVLQEMIIPNGVEVKSFTLETSFTNSTRTKRTAGGELFTQSTGGLVNILPGHRTTAELNYVNHPSLTLTPTTKTFHKMAANIKVISDGLVGGEISTPNYPNDYPNGADITWVISYPPNNKIHFEMLYFSMEECCDHLTIYEGTNKSHSVLATFDGDFYPGSSNVVVSSQPAIFLRFTSDCLVSGSGFRASYINQPKYTPPAVTTPSPMSCGYVHVYSGNSGYVTSPGYNDVNYYESNMNCTWSVQTYDGTRVRFTVDHFHLNYNDSLYFYDGTISYPGRLLVVLSGSVSSGYTVTADSNRAFLMFYSSSSHHGFDINYEGTGAPVTTVPSHVETSTVYYNPVQCVLGSVSFLSGGSHVTSPGYYSPNLYPAYESCQWRITVYSGYVVRLWVHYFNIEYYYDWVYVYDGHSTSNSARIANLTGSIADGSTVAITSSNQATVTFQSDCCVNYPGFDIHVGYTYGTFTTDSPHNEVTTSYNATCSSPEYYSGYDGYITSPHYPDYYDNNLNCSYFIQTPYETYVRIYIQSFYLATGDYLRIYNGRTGSYIGEMSGYHSYNFLMNTFTDYIQLFFTSDSYYTNPGFNIRYDAVPEGYHNTTAISYNCGNDTMPYNYGNITSPGYPYNSYTDYLDCVWTVQVYSYMYVLFTINYFNTESNYDYVTFYKGTPHNSQGAVVSYTGQVSAGIEILVRDNNAFVIFHTDGSVTDPGFSISYSPVSQDYISRSTADSYAAIRNKDSTRYQYEVGRVGSPKIIGRDLWEGAKNRPPRRKEENGRKKNP